MKFTSQKILTNNLWRKYKINLRLPRLPQNQKAGISEALGYIPGIMMSRRVSKEQRLIETCQIHRRMVQVEAVTVCTTAEIVKIKEMNSPDIF